MVHFHPRELLKETELDANSLTYALRELGDLDVFTYVPPFRGRAIRMIHRDPPFDDLQIDFDTLERRKAAEYGKLKRVIYFATSASAGSRRYSVISATKTHGPWAIAITAAVWESALAGESRPPRRPMARPGPPSKRGRREMPSWFAACGSSSAESRGPNSGSPAARI